MTTNTGMLNAFLGTLPKLERSWSLMLEEVIWILWRWIISTSHRWFKVVHQPKECSWASVSLTTTLNLEWQVVAQAHLNFCLWLQLWIWNDRLWFRLAWIIWRGRNSTSHRWFKADNQPKACSWESVSLAITLNLEWQVVAQARLNWCLFGYNYEYGMISCGSDSLDVALKLVDDHQDRKSVV